MTTLAETLDRLAPVAKAGKAEGYEADAEAYANQLLLRLNDLYGRMVAALGRYDGDHPLREQISDRLDQLNSWMTNIEQALDSGNEDDVSLVLTRSEDMEAALQEWEHYAKSNGAAATPKARPSLAQLLQLLEPKRAAPAEIKAAAGGIDTLRQMRERIVALHQQFKALQVEAERITAAYAASDDVEENRQLVEGLRALKTQADACLEAASEIEGTVGDVATAIVDEASELQSEIEDKAADITTDDLPGAIEFRIEDIEDWLEMSASEGEQE